MATTTSKPAVPRNLTFADSDYVDPPAPRETAAATITGMEGSGKTTAALLYAPSPICYIDIDQGGLWAVENALNAGKEIKYTSIEYPHNYSALDEATAKKLGQAQVDKFVKNHEIAVRESQRGNVRTIVWDTGTELAEIVNIALAGRPERKNDDYGATPSAQKVVLANMIKMAEKEGQANLIILCRAKEIYEMRPGSSRKEASGEFTARGPDTFLFDVDWVGHLKVTKRKIREKGTFAHELKIMKSRVNFATFGDVYKEEDWDETGPFIYACMWQYGKPASTWE